MFCEPSGGLASSEGGANDASSSDAIERGREGDSDASETCEEKSHE